MVAAIGLPEDQRAASFHYNAGHVTWKEQIRVDAVPRGTRPSVTASHPFWLPAAF